MKTKNSKKILITLITFIIIAVSSQVLTFTSNGMDANQKINNKEDYIAYYKLTENTQEELNKLINQGYSESDIRIAYAFLNDVYGKKEEIINILDEAKKGAKWNSIFSNYNKSHEQFIPRAFDTDYLEKLTKSDNITSDDIMICDHLSAVTELEFDELMKRNMEGETWQQISDDIGVINNQNTLIKLQVTTEQINKYKNNYGLTEQKIVECFVLANKFDIEVSNVLVKVMNGTTNEQLMTYYLEEKFK